MTQDPSPSGWAWQFRASALSRGTIPDAPPLARHIFHACPLGAHVALTGRDPMMKRVAQSLCSGPATINTAFEVLRAVAIPGWIVFVFVNCDGSGGSIGYEAIEPTPGGHTYRLTLFRFGGPVKERLGGPRLPYAELSGFRRVVVDVDR